MIVWVSEVAFNDESFDLYVESALEDDIGQLQEILRLLVLVDADESDSLLEPIEVDL